MISQPFKVWLRVSQWYRLTILRPQGPPFPGLGLGLGGVFPNPNPTPENGRPEQPSLLAVTFQPR